jgi:hypothetical protein
VALGLELAGHGKILAGHRGLMISTDEEIPTSPKGWEKWAPAMLLVFRKDELISLPLAVMRSPPTVAFATTRERRPWGNRPHRLSELRRIGEWASR